MRGDSGRGSGDEAANNASLIPLICLGKRGVLTLKLSRYMRQLHKQVQLPMP